jgi:hypothetical protein
MKETYTVAELTIFKAKPLDTFLFTSFPAKLSDIPGIGEKSIEGFAVAKIITATQLAQRLLKLEGDLRECLKLFSECIPKEAHPNQICVLVLLKLSMMFDLPEPPKNWAEIAFPNKK